MPPPPSYRLPSARTKQNGHLHQPGLRLRQTCFEKMQPSRWVRLISTLWAARQPLRAGSDFDRRCISGAVVEVTGDQTASHIGEDRLLLRAAVHCARAARVEATPRWRVERARHLAGQDDLLAPLVGVA